MLVVESNKNVQKTVIKVQIMNGGTDNCERGTRCRVQGMSKEVSNKEK